MLAVAAITSAVVLGWKRAKKHPHIAARLLVRFVSSIQSIDSLINLQVKGKLFLGFFQARTVL